MDPISILDLTALGCKTAIIVLLLFFGYRVLGKRQAGQMNLYDLVTLMAVSNAVQNAMTSGKGNLVVGIVCSSVIIGLAWLITKFFLAAPKLECRIIGVPTVLVQDGHLFEGRMHKESVSDDELKVAMRQHGLINLSDIKLAVLEVDGTISIVPTE